MDRGRVGYNKVGNKTLRENHIKHVRLVHLERLRKIRTRLPGTSSTLDNQLPRNAGKDSQLLNPRKASLKREHNRVVLRQNKVLLQRISNILTAPPTIDDKDYLRMRKLVSTMRGPREIYEHNLIMQKNKEFFRGLKNVGPYYSTKTWENAYQRQLFGQRFMRQVPYERPKDFIDHYASVSANPVPSKEYKLLRRRQAANRKFSLNEDVTQSLEILDVDEAGDRKFDQESRLTRCGIRVNDMKNVMYGVEVAPIENSQQASVSNCLDNTPSYREQGVDNLQEGVDFGKVERNIKIIERTAASSNQYSCIHEANAIISCWLIIRDFDLGSLVISANVIEGRRAGIFAEAEISLLQLFNFKGIMMECMEADPNVLNSTIREILETVELRIEDVHARLVLSLPSSKFMDDSLYSEGTSLEDSGSQDSVFARDSVDAESAAVIETISHKSLDVPMVYSSIKGETEKRCETLRSYVEVELNEDLIKISVVTISDSKNIEIGDHTVPAIPSNSRFCADTKLPSLAFIDVDAMSSFMENLVSCIQIKYDDVNGWSLHIQEEIFD